MPALVPTDVTIDGNLLDPQPSRLVPHKPPANRRRAVGGLYRSVTPEFGWWFELIWGSEEVVDSEPIAMLRALQASMGETVTLVYTDVDGTIQTFTCLWDEEVVASIHWGSIAERFSIELFQTAEPIGS